CRHHRTREALMGEAPLPRTGCRRALSRSGPDYLSLPRAAHVFAVDSAPAIRFLAGQIRVRHTGAVVVLEGGSGDGVAIQEVEGDASAVAVGVIAECTVRHAIGEKDGPARRQLDGNRALFRRIAADVMVALRVALVRVGFAVAAGNDVQRSI